MKLFREANEASFAWNYAKTLLQTVVMWSIFLVFGPWLVAWLETQVGLPKLPAQQLLGVLIFVAGGSLGMTSGYTMARRGGGTPLPMDTARHMVIAGPYRYVRNPMAVAGTIQSTAVGLFLGSPAVLAATAVSALLWNYAVRPPEEADLVARFGAPFERYQAHVRCWIPKTKPFDP